MIKQNPHELLIFCARPIMLDQFNPGNSIRPFITMVRKGITPVANEIVDCSYQKEIEMTIPNEMTLCILCLRV
jgi:hypothetical protein